MPLTPSHIASDDVVHGAFIRHGGPFYLAWVNETETTFGPEHHRMDEHVFSARRVLAEGEKPKLELVIENPRVGLLSALRKQWCWFAWDNGSTVVPLFFGRIVGIPTDLQAEVITITFIAWPSNYKKQLQILAETLKTAPYYDPVFTDVARRDDPLSIFESHSKIIVVDPVTNVVSASDILDAEDGNVDFTEDDHFYDSLHVSPSAVPKTAIHVDASVSWTQTARGYLGSINQSFASFTGMGFIGEWPKVGSQIADGLRVFSSVAYDSAGIDNIQMKTISTTWQNKEKQHNDGDCLSASSSVTVPGGGGPRGSVLDIGVLTSYKSQAGFLDPFATDGNGDPSPTNIPASLSGTKAYSFAYGVKASMTLEYTAARPHTERIIFNLRANVQPTTLDPTVSEDSETITISGSDVGVPIINLLNWTTVSGQAVVVGTVVFPDDPALPGGQTAQVCVVAGTAGTVSPDFSDVVGDTTVDGTVTWASLGVAQPTESAPDWTGVSHVPAGTILLPRRPIYLTWFNATADSRLDSSPRNSSASAGQIIQATNGSYQVAVVGGQYQGGPLGYEANFSATWNALTTDGEVDWRSLGLTLPTGKHYYIAANSGTTGSQYVTPAFGTVTALHGTIVDGGVTWICLGEADIPAGGTPGQVHASTYFGQDRGRQSIEHLICRARARLRYASRCVATRFQCSYQRGAELSLRKSATLHDSRLPSGLLLGKITGTELIADGGAFICNVTVQSSVGLEETVAEVAGTPTYVSTGYVTTGYQRMDGQIVILPVISDVGYTPIVPVPDEDGIVFPLTKEMIVVREETHGLIGDQNSEITGYLSASTGGTRFLNTVHNNPGTITREQMESDAAAGNPLEIVLRNPIWYELEMKPLNGNGSFNHVYHLKCTTLSLPKMVNLDEEITS